MLKIGSLGTFFKYGLLLTSSDLRWLPLTSDDFLSQHAIAYVDHRYNITMHAKNRKKSSPNKMLKNLIFRPKKQTKSAEISVFLQSYEF